MLLLQVPVPATASQAATKQAVVHLCELAVDAVEQQVSRVGNTPDTTAAPKAPATTTSSTTQQGGTAAGGQGDPGSGGCFTGAKPVAVMGPVSLVDGCVQLLVAAATCGKYTAPTAGTMLDQLQALVAATGPQGLQGVLMPGAGAKPAAGGSGDSRLKLMVQLDGDTAATSTTAATARDVTASDTLGAAPSSSNASSSAGPGALLLQGMTAPEAGGGAAGGASSTFVTTPPTTTTSSSVGVTWSSAWLDPPLLQLPPTLSDGYGTQQLEVAVGGLPAGRPLRLLLLGWEGAVALDQAMVAEEVEAPSGGEAGGQAGDKNGQLR